MLCYNFINVVDYMEVTLMNEKLGKVIDSLKLFPSLVSQNATIEVYDEDMVVAYSDNRVSGCESRLVGSFAGSDSSIIRSVISSNSPSHEVAELGNGKKIDCNYVPLSDETGVFGCVVSRMVVKSNDVAMEKAELFMGCIDNINSAIDMMSIHFENLFGKLQEMQEKTGYISNDVENTSVIVSKIRANASKSKILALNASIEAARSGEAGRGFTVVAKEMGEMATASGTSASDINDALKSIFGSLDNITSSITEANGLAQKQTASIKEIEEYLSAALSAAQELGEALVEE